MLFFKDLLYYFIIQLLIYLIYLVYLLFLFLLFIWCG